MQDPNDYADELKRANGAMNAPAHVVGVIDVRTASCTTITTTTWSGFARPPVAGVAQPGRAKRRTRARTP